MLTSINVHAQGEFGLPDGVTLEERACRFVQGVTPARVATGKCVTKIPQSYLFLSTHV
jgi:hypothetical protein